MDPLVSVIGISYNHAPYIEEALESVFAQDYQPLEMIILDDGSQDKSQQAIDRLVRGREGIRFVKHYRNRGYTRTFNEGLASSGGKYIIDFALDDVMMPGFIKKSVEALECSGEEYGVCFTDAAYIDEHSAVIGTHFDRLKKKGMIARMPQGDIFERVLARYFICTPTMVIKREVFDRMGKYDETLAYEDFDFWVRSSRHFNYRYLDEVLMKKRKLKTGMSASRYHYRSNDQLRSTFVVCQKAFQRCKTRSEFKALRIRVAYELRDCITKGLDDLAWDYLKLLRKSGENRAVSMLYTLMIRSGISWSFLDRFRHKP